MDNHLIYIVKMTCKRSECLKFRLICNSPTENVGLLFYLSFRFFENPDIIVLCAALQGGL